MERTSGREKLITSIDCLEPGAVCQSLCFTETSQLPAAGVDVTTTDGDEALAGSCRDAAEGMECRDEPAIPCPHPCQNG